jgi:hypothetical protein
VSEDTIATLLYSWAGISLILSVLFSARLFLTKGVDETFRREMNTAKDRLASRTQKGGDHE